MADPARYYIDPVLKPNATGVEAGLIVEQSQHGEWIKWFDFVDYKAAQRRNASAEVNTKLGVEIAELHSKVADLRAEIARLRGGRRA